jgi:hypothetical protein
MGGRKLDWSPAGQGEVVGCCESGNDKFIDQLRN